MRFILGNVITSVPRIMGSSEGIFSASGDLFQGKENLLKVGHRPTALNSNSHSRAKEE